jgi:ferredoxin, 2Fe-2S
MAAVTYVDYQGTRRTLDVANGDTVMQAAVSHMLTGIIGECGGALACATCHCYVEAAWIDRVGPPSATETEMLESAASPTKPGSRLSCQITISDALDGLVVHLPESQI